MTLALVVVLDFSENFTEEELCPVQGKEEQGIWCSGNCQSRNQRLGRT